jgi:ribosome-associated protein
MLGFYSNHLTFEDSVIKAQLFPSAITDLTALIETALEDSKAEDIVVIDLHGKTDMADYMIVASGTSDRHVASIAHRLYDTLKISGAPYLNMEGQETGHWVLVDTGDVIIHLFKPETRAYYNLEKMWSAPVQKAEAIVS